MRAERKREKDITAEREQAEHFFLKKKEKEMIVRRCEVWDSVSERKRGNFYRDINATGGKRDKGRA